MLCLMYITYTCTCYSLVNMGASCMYMYIYIVCVIMNAYVASVRVSKSQK